MPEDSKIPYVSFFKSRQRVDLENLQPEQVRIEDIAHDLSIIPRFAGGTARPYSVAEHSLMVMEMVGAQNADPETMLQALMHDATEYIIGDIPAPVKALIPEIRDWEQQVLWPVICEAFDIQTEISPIVKTADWVALYVEAHSLYVTDVLEEWECYDKYMPMAEAWMEAHGEIAADNMPHPALIEKVFIDTFETLRAACEAPDLEEAVG